MASKIYSLFWIDSTENHQDIEKIFLSNPGNPLKFYFFKDLKSAIDEMTKIKFEDIFIIIKENLYQEYLSKLNDIKSQITCFPISIIYLTNNKIDLNSENYNGFGGIIKSRAGAIKFIRDFIASVNRKIKLSPKHVVNVNYNNTLTFEKIKNNDDLIIPSLYILNKKIKGKENVIEDKDIYKFNQILVNNHFYQGISHLIVPLNDIKKLPLEIVTKFWIRYYTSQSSFYSYMNSQLMKNKPENYEIFIRAMYQGVEKKYLKSEFSIQLYRCQLISKSELGELEKNKVLIYSRSFLSFSKDKNVSIKFLKKAKNDLIPIMFILNTMGVNEDFSSNADIEPYSIYKEKEVLFFPFSSFLVEKEIKTEIINNIETKIIYLNYLGKYRKEIEEKIKSLDKAKIKELLNRDLKFLQDISSIILEENGSNDNIIDLQKTVEETVKNVQNYYKILEFNYNSYKEENAEIGKNINENIVKLNKIVPEDNLGIENILIIKQELGNEKIYYSTNIKKINFGFFTKIQERSFLITNIAVYNIKGTEIRKRLKIEDILGISYSTQSQQFIIHMNENEYDYVFLSPKRKKIVKFLQYLHKNIKCEDLLFCLRNESNLKCFVVSKKERENNPYLFKIDKRESTSIEEFLRSQDDYCEEDEGYY